MNRVEAFSNDFEIYKRSFVEFLELVYHARFSFLLCLYFLGV